MNTPLRGTSAWEEIENEYYQNHYIHNDGTGKVKIKNFDLEDNSIEKYNDWNTMSDNKINNINYFINVTQFYYTETFYKEYGPITLRFSIQEEKLVIDCSNESMVHIEHYSDLKFTCVFTNTNKLTLKHLALIIEQALNNSRTLLEMDPDWHGN